MKSIKSNNKNKGSILIAVIGILAVLSVMALRFNVEMETAMIKVAGKGIASDVKVLANGGLQYSIAEILADGSNLTQLRIEQEMEVDTGSSAVGWGVGRVSGLHADTFHDTNSTLSEGNIPMTSDLHPGKFNYMIEDLSAKLPIGHVSQWYQRHLISSVLCKKLTGRVPSNTGYQPAATGNMLTDVNTELIDVTEASSDKFNGYDKRDAGGAYVFLRSLLPYDVANVAGNDRLITGGLPLADGIIATEELGSAYTWKTGASDDKNRRLTTDLQRGKYDYLDLASSLTPFARFVHDPNNPNVSFASINPMIMYSQDSALYKSLFYYDKNDYRLKVVYSVGFDPKGGVKTDDTGTFKVALADPDFFKNNIGDYMMSTIMPSEVSATQGAYNARSDKDDLNSTLATAIGVTADTSRSWRDGEFASATGYDPSTAAKIKETAYYYAMEKAVKRMSDAFKGNGVMCPVMTRKTLEFAIIKSVFGDSISFVGKDNKLITNKVQVYKAIYSDNAIDLAKVKFVENAFDKYNDANMLAKYFVPNWKKYEEGCVTSTKYLANSGDSDIKAPVLGLYKDGADYVTYLPNPITNQKWLNNSFVSIAMAYSYDNKSNVIASTLKPQSDIEFHNLYTGLNPADKGKAAFDTTDTGEAVYDFGTNSVVQPAPGSNYVKLYDTNQTAPVLGSPAKDERAANFKPADFSPYETKIRMAVLVNLLNAVIADKISPTSNASNADATFFSTSKAGSALNLKDFIYFENGEYKINSQPKFMSGWEAGIKTPGMTFWKYGVHSTTFQITVDAYKYDDNVRLSTVVTFDNNVISTMSGTTATWDKTKPKYELDTDDKKKAVYSNLYLNPLGRAQVNADKYSIGKGELRYPTIGKTDSWVILSSVWSSTSRTGSGSSESFQDIDLLTEDVVNKGPVDGYWHFVQHPKELGITGNVFTRFFVDVSGKSWIFRGDDYSIAPPPAPSKKRMLVCGAGSWLKWPPREFSKTMSSGTLMLGISFTPANANTGYTMLHTVKIVNIKDNTQTYSIPISTYSGWGSTGYSEVPINVKIEKGMYEITLTENKDTYWGPYQNYSDGSEHVRKIRIFEK